MTKDEICGLLRQIHDVLVMQSETNQVKPVALIDAEIRKAVEAEREACAEICKKHADVYAGLEQNPTTQSAWAACIDNLDAIRARGQA